MLEMVAALLEVGAYIVKSRSICDTCSSLDSRFILNDNRATGGLIRSGLKEFVANDDGLIYRPAYKFCFMGCSSILNNLDKG